MEAGKIREIAEAGIRRAARWLQGARRAVEDERWDDAVYNAQMCVEQSSKALLLALGIDFPKGHDVSPPLLRLNRRRDLPDWFRAELDEMARVVSELAEERGLAGYGFEKGMEVEYFKELAPEALRKGEKIHKLCKRTLESMLSKGKGSEGRGHAQPSQGED
jgi:HEPN domain-containing protein